MISVYRITEDLVGRYEEPLCDILNDYYQGNPLVVTLENLEDELASYLPEAGGGFLFATDLGLPAGCAAYRPVEEGVCLLEAFHGVENRDPRLSGILLEQVCKAALGDGYGALRIDLAFLFNTDILADPYILDYCPGMLSFFDNMDEAVDLPLVI